ncbi:hypothetical protein ABVT39_003343 [Epinephelus coioides]
MDYLTFFLINGPLVIINIVANAFYMFCIVCPLHGGRIKQPLKLLLTSLICCTVTYLISVFVMVFFIKQRGAWVTGIAYVGALCSLSTSMTSSVWLNFFYYTQIVPAQRAIFIWIKKNIKTIVYCIWLTEIIYSFIDLAALLLPAVVLFYASESSFSVTVDHFMLATVSSNWAIDMFLIGVFISKAYFMLCLCVMVMSSGSTVVYLSRDMHRMVANGQPISGPRFSGQVRVTVTGILQGVLYVLCAVWTMFCFFAQFFMSLFHDLYIQFTLINLYMSGTTFNLGAGQAVFRQRAADIWLRAARFCKATQVQQSEQRG